MEINSRGIPEIAGLLWPGNLSSRGKKSSLDHMCEANLSLLFKFITFETIYSLNSQKPQLNRATVRLQIFWNVPAICPPTFLPVFTCVIMQFRPQRDAYSCVCAQRFARLLIALSPNTPVNNALRAKSRKRQRRREAETQVSRVGGGVGWGGRQGEPSLWSHANTTHTGDVGVYVGKQSSSL